MLYYENYLIFLKWANLKPSWRESNRYETDYSNLKHMNNAVNLKINHCVIFNVVCCVLARVGDHYWACWQISRDDSCLTNVVFSVCQNLPQSHPVSPPQPLPLLKDWWFLIVNFVILAPAGDWQTKSRTNMSRHSEYLISSQKWKSI